MMTANGSNNQQQQGNEQQQGRDLAEQKKRIAQRLAQLYTQLETK